MGRSLRCHQVWILEERKQVAAVHSPLTVTNIDCLVGNSYIFRSTLTIPTEWSLILVGFFTLYIKYSSGSLWGTIRFVLHQLKATPKLQDDLYHQTQVVLRNTESESTFINGLIQVGWAHQGSRFKAYRRSFFLLLLAVVYGLGFGLVGALNSRLITAHDSSVLSLSKNCGWLHAGNQFNLSRLEDKDFEAANALVVMTRNNYRKSATYSRTCYGRDSENTNSTTCKTYVHTTLPYSTQRSAPCPFADKACNGTAITFDTGYLRSDEHLGINTSPENALSVRKILTCAPIAGERYTDGWLPIPAQLAATTFYDADAQWKPYAFGLSARLSGSFMIRNYTFINDDVLSKFGDQPYSLGWVTNNIDIPPELLWQMTPFSPIDDLRNKTADLQVIGITNRNVYRQPINDPWFQADNCTTDPTGMLTVTCVSSNPQAFLGCHEQYSFCKGLSADSQSCTPLTGIFPHAPADISLTTASQRTLKANLQLNPTQNAIYDLLWNILWASQLNFQLGFIGQENLIAQEYLWDGGFGFRISANLSPNHWQTEVENWMNTTLAAIQRGTAVFARPASYDLTAGTSSLQFITKPTNNEIAKLCHKVRVRNAGQTSFSVFNMALIIALGLLCIFSDLYLSRLVACVQESTGRGLHKKLEWAESSSFQLQRMAAEGRGVGPWRGKEDEVPRLEDPGQLFNLTGVSLRGRGEEGGYRGLRQRASSEEDRVGGGVFGVQRIGVGPGKGV
ncbi:hypothetical protein B0J11DRAFT_504435 [Dendryphion nanum]|uniref:Uncharacterized protein n=1 Tax=Dendryphion nanum TaxID=256645 RepID=A0A9P9E663_9PLEO|nr:hypothetical protein B0J11DRAFT_504435 [Dendryphion nanum]